MPKVDNKTFYSSAIEKYGITAKGVNWYSKESQKLRFEIILEMLPKEMHKYSVADAGCGFGDLYLYMQKKKRAPKEYIGIDALVDMYSIASERTGCEIVVADICKDRLPPADFYICSGAMNVLEKFETHLFIQNCFSACRVGFIFNVLHGEKNRIASKIFCKFIFSTFNLFQIFPRNIFSLKPFSISIYSERY